MNRIIFQLNKLLQPLALVLARRETPAALHLRNFLATHRFDTIVDVGANGGQYGGELRHAGFGERIISFEPLGDAFAKLSQRASADANWQCVNAALSDSNKKLRLNVSQATEFSSALPVLAGTVSRDANAKVTRVEEVEARPFDDIWSEMKLDGQSVLLKIDTQGSEEQILKGARQSLPKLSAVQLELSADPIYEGQPLMESMIGLLRQEGFVPYLLWPGFHDEKTGRVLEYDGLFVRA
jgi:FkbM family methyltransferase